MTEKLPTMEEKIKEAVVAELKRQAEANPDGLKLSAKGARLTVDGEIDLDDLAMVMIGAVAGGP